MDTKKKKSLLSNIENYLSRHTSEQQIPSGYKSFDELIKLLGVKKSKLNAIISGLRKMKKIESVWVRRSNGTRCFKKRYYRIDAQFFKDVSKAD